ncbi:O-antigen ligase family protein [Candidatus Sumerlaeota bacterium]|nr:O-antigen ligase family protein [Candidatus Sumerlaeota bacterium]
MNQAFRMKWNLYEFILLISLVFLLAGTALFITRFTFNSYDLPKNAWIEVWTKALLCFAIGGIFFNRPFRIMFSPLTGLLALYFLWNVISGFVAGSKSLWGGEVLRIFWLLLFALMFQNLLYGNRRRLLYIIWAMALSAMMTAGWTLYQDLIASFYPNMLTVESRLSDWRGYIAAGFGNTGYIADYLAVLFPMNLLLYLHVRGKVYEILTLATLVSSYAALLVCWSVQSNAGLLIALLILLYFLIKEKSRWFWKRRKRRILILIAGFILVTVFYTLPIPINPHKPSLFKEAFSSERWHFGGESRIVIWAQSLEIIRKHSWLGCGAGNFTWQYVQQVSPYLMSEKYLAYIGMYSNAAHNELLQSWGELGIAGPVLLFLILFFTCRGLLKYAWEDSFINRWIRIGAFCFIICSVLPAMMAYPLRIPTSSLLFFAVCSLPVVIVPRGRFFSDTMRIPVDFDWNAIKAIVILENFHKPVGCGVRADLPRKLSRLVAFGLVMIFLPWAFQSIMPVISDTLFKQGKTYIKAYEAGYGSEKDAERGEYLMKRALVWWRNHHDCRSALGQYLFRRRRYEEAVYQLHITLKRLQARELYETLGMCLDSLGREKDALMAYHIFFARNPVMAYIKPKLYQRFLELQKSSI